MPDSKLEHMLDQYRMAVRATAWAETHGTHGDGKPAIRRQEETALRAQIRAYVSNITA